MDSLGLDRSATLDVKQVLLDQNDRLLPPKPIIFLSQESFTYVKSFFPELNLKNGAYVWLKGKKGSTCARVLIDSSIASLGAQGCALSSVLAISLFHTTVCSVLKLEVLRHLPKSIIAQSLELSLCPFYLSSIDAGRKLIATLPNINGPLAALCIPGSTTMTRGSFLVINWFNRLDLIHVVDCQASSSEVSTHSNDSFDASMFLSTASTAIKFVPWRESFLPLSDTSLESSTSSIENMILPTPETVKARLKASVGGLQGVISSLVDCSFAALLNATHSELPRGFLFCGVSGSGKTHLAKEFAKHCGLKAAVVNTPEIFKSGEGASEAALSDVFAQVRTLGPSVLILEELEAIASNRKSMEGAIERRLLTHFLTLLDQLWNSWDDQSSPTDSSNVSTSSQHGKFSSTGRKPQRTLVIGICSSIASLDPSVTRPKRLEKVLHFNIPTPSERLEILKIQTKNFPPLESNSTSQSLPDPLSTPSKSLAHSTSSTSTKHVGTTLERIAHRTPGFTGSDLANLCRHTLLSHLKKISQGIAGIDLSSSIASSIDLPPIPFESFESSLSVIKASALSSYSTNHAIVSFDELRGIDDIIHSLKASLIAPFEESERFKKLGAKPPSGVLLYGPPGVGKSKIAMAVASQSKVNFLTVNATEIVSKVVGESEQNLSKLFASARAASPCILFIDQIEAIARNRSSDSSESQSSDRILSLLLTQMDGIEKNSSDGFGSNKSEIDSALIVLAATNKPHLLDSAILRPGRFDHVLYVPPPTPQTRKEMIDYFITKTPCKDVTDAQWTELSKLTKGFTGADLESLFREASYLALKKDINTSHVTWQDLMDVLPTVPASLLSASISHPYNSKVGFSFIS